MGFTTPVTNGSLITPKVRVRQSVVGDGTAYNGNAPRLILRKNVPLGITSDTVIATYSGASGSFQDVTGNTPVPTDDGVMEFVVDCDGTTGWINLDNFSVT